jgi:D-glucosaminate-6-phosphate ammonia-lyase
MHPSRKPSRRTVLQAGAGLAAAGVLGEMAVATQSPKNVYDALGVTRVINATGTFTALGGSVMPPEVAAAWVEASRSFVDLVELHEKASARIAQLLGVEAALITTGAAGALFLGTAAAVTRGDAKFVARLPDTTGMKNEVLIQKAHRSCYDNQLTGVGAKLVEVETAADVAKAVNDRTALMFFMNYMEAEGTIKRAEWVELARKHNVPTLNDAAADVPPVSRLAEYAKQGFDLIAVSGGKAMRGPNDTGLLLGRRELIDAARRNANPHCGTIGRMMKVSKEDMVALVAAVERFVKLDPDAERKEFERKIAVIEAAVKEIPTVVCERITPPISNHVPHLQITWDESRLKTTAAKVTRALAAGSPPVRIGRVTHTGDRGILISVLCLQGDEEKEVARRVAEVLRKAAG